MALADAYDALTSKRVYKPAVSHEKAVEVIGGEKGKHFDPEVVEAFLNARQEFEEIFRRHADD
jgi:putative two-component system response regulator